MVWRNLPSQPIVAVAGLPVVATLVRRRPGQDAPDDTRAPAPIVPGPALLLRIGVR